MQSAGQLIDLAHANAQTTEAALKLKARPVIISHTGLDAQLGNDQRMAQMMRPRRISKAHAKMVADAGGAVGVWTHLADTPFDFAHNICALVDVIGVEHVCIGTDTKLTQPSPRPASAPPWITVDLPVVLAVLRLTHSLSSRDRVWGNARTWHGFHYFVVDAMLKTGFTPVEIEKISGANYLRIFAEAVDN